MGLFDVVFDAVDKVMMPLCDKVIDPALEKAGEMKDNLADWAASQFPEVTDAASEIAERLLPDEIVEGKCPKDVNPNCEYSIDECKCSDQNGSCSLLNSIVQGRKPPCQSACEVNAILWTGSHMEIDSWKCTNCGKCGEACMHYAVERNGEPVGLTMGKAAKLIALGAVKGVAKTVLLK